MTQADLAKRIGKTRQFILNAEICCIKIDTLQLITTALNCSAMDILPELDYKFGLRVSEWKTIKAIPNDTLSIAIGKRVKVIRKISKYSQLKLADIIDCEQKDISQLEQHGCKKIKTLYALATALHCPIHILLGSNPSE